MTKKTDLDQETKNRLEDAVKNLKEIQEKISPFVQEREIVDFSTAGKWMPSEINQEVFTRVDFHDFLKKISQPRLKSDVKA
jgi:hypothetical protein